MIKTHTGKATAIELNARASTDFDAKLAQTQALLVQAATTYPSEQITQASSLGAEDMVVSHLIRSLGLKISIFVLDTGMLHDETLALLADLKAAARVPVHVYAPVHEAVVSFVKREGKDPMYRSIELRKACCNIRKMEPLARALDGKAAWVTGLRREQSGARAEVPLTDTSNSVRVKFNPLADWTWGDVWHYISLHKVAYNALHYRFYPSIGCAPCTRAISVGEDFRAGRWWWEDESAKECGLHAQDHAQDQAQETRKETTDITQITKTTEETTA